MEPAGRLVQLRALANDIPDLATSLNTFEITTEAQIWLGRLHALALESGDTFAGISLVTHGPLLRGLTNGLARAEILGVLYRLIASQELLAPPGAQPAFIGVGSSFDALAAIGRVLATAHHDLLVIDPYLDERFLLDFATLAKAGVALRLLADQASLKPGLRPATARWRKQYGDHRPVDVRLSAPKALHDRLIVVDGSAVWDVSQSFNALAARSPASLVQSDAERALLKASAYEEQWRTARPLPLDQ
jgi:hypothetical protein